MKIPKKRWGDIAWIVLLIIILFTPLGKAIKIEVNKLIAFSPSVIEQKDAIQLEVFNWQLQELKTGELINLNDLKNQVVFINTWATWCPPCLAEMPEINDLYTDYKDKITFLIVSTDEEKALREYMNQNGYVFKNYHPLSNVPQDLNSTSIPHTIVIDKSGYIRVDKVGSAKWNHKDFRKALDKMILE